MARKGKRRYFKAAEKVAILKRHLVEREEVSAICEDLKIHPNQFYEWQKLFFENGVKAFESLENREEELLRIKVSALESKLQRKDAVLSELMEAHLALKKNFGEIFPRCSRATTSDTPHPRVQRHPAAAKHYPKLHPIH